MAQFTNGDVGRHGFRTTTIDLGQNLSNIRSANRIANRIMRQSGAIPPSTPLAVLRTVRYQFRTRETPRDSSTVLTFDSQK